jgi:hypothetical protein
VAIAKPSICPVNARGTWNERPASTLTKSRDATLERNVHAVGVRRIDGADEDRDFGRRIERHWPLDPGLAAVGRDEERRRAYRGKASRPREVQPLRIAGSDVQRRDRHSGIERAAALRPARPSSSLSQMRVSRDAIPASSKT